MMGLLCASGLGEVASYGRREEGQSCVLGSVGSQAAYEARLGRVWMYV